MPSLKMLLYHSLKNYLILKYLPMSIKSFLFITLFLFGYLLYSSLMWGLLIVQPIIGYITNVHSIKLGLLLSIINPLSSLAYVSQLKLAFNKGIDDKWENNALIWGAILFPFIVWIVSLIFRLVL